MLKEIKLQEKTHLDDNSTFIETNGNFIPALLVRHTPSPLKPIAQSVLQSIRRRVPDLDGPVFGTRDDDRQ